MASFEALRDKCLKRGILFEDPDFPAENRSIYFSKFDPRIRWRRPKEICADPKFIVENACRFDFDQGSIGNCWYVAAAAVLATRPQLLRKVVPLDQNFRENYAGIFRFNFWQYGQWREVVIDDRLPTLGGQFLVFCSNKEEKNEFWTALMEKAYAKLYGSYEALEGGWTEDALVDFTGGVGSRINLKHPEQLPKDFFEDFLCSQDKFNTLLGCSIGATKETMEAVLGNGLVIGHAYSITRVLTIKQSGKVFRLLRLRNPWGKKEWNGAWSDASPEWKRFDAKTRQAIGLTVTEDGEFWMSYEDLLKNFETMEICYLSKKNDLEVASLGHWDERIHHGSWVRGVSAGGCGNPPYQSAYWINPQYSLSLEVPDDGSEECTLIVSLMQKYSRRKRNVLRSDMANIPINFDLYQIKSRYVPETLDGQKFDQMALRLARRGGQYAFYREISQFFKLKPGAYVVIPAVFEPNVQGDFMLRFYTVKSAKSSEMDVLTGPIRQPEAHKMSLQELFTKYAGDDSVIDAQELQALLNDAFKEDLGENLSFDLEPCRSLLTMMDKNRSGVLEFNEMNAMWTELKMWRGVFKQFDKDKSGFIDVSELRSVFKSVGYSLSRKVLESVVRRYGGKRGRLTFNDFILVTTKIVTLLNCFSSGSGEGLKGSMELNLEQFVQLGMYF